MENNITTEEFIEKYIATEELKSIENLNEGGCAYVAFEIYKKALDFNLKPKIIECSDRKTNALHFFIRINNYLFDGLNVYYEKDNWFTKLYYIITSQLKFKEIDFNKFSTDLDKINWNPKFNKNDIEKIKNNFFR